MNAVDANVLIYAVDTAEPQKSAIARSLLIVDLQAQILSTVNSQAIGITCQNPQMYEERCHLGIITSYSCDGFAIQAKRLKSNYSGEFYGR